MEDSKIIELYWQRSEDAISETQSKYGRYCHSIAYNILYSNEDAEECVNDTYVKAWDSIPPTRPKRLSAFIGRITRNLALDRYEARNAQKRGGEVALALDEIAECVPDTQGEVSSDEALKEAINGFIGSLSARKRVIFLRRYWYAFSVADIAVSLGMSESNVKVTLMRIRTDFKEYLAGKGITV